MVVLRNFGWREQPECRMRSTHLLIWISFGYKADVLYIWPRIWIPLQHSQTSDAVLSIVILSSVKDIFDVARSKQTTSGGYQSNTLHNYGRLYQTRTRTTASCSSSHSCEWQQYVWGKRIDPSSNYIIVMLSG